MKAICRFIVGDTYNKQNISGHILFQSVDRETKIIFDLKGFEPNKIYAIHIHEFGDLSMDIGPHYNPTGKLHGNRWIHGNDRHAGDLINNLHSDFNGDFKYECLDPMIIIDDIIGRSVVIHSGIDDCGVYRNDNTVSIGKKEGSASTGNTKGRVACSVVYAMN